MAIYGCHFMTVSLALTALGPPTVTSVTVYHVTITLLEGFSNNMFVTCEKYDTYKC